MFAPDSYSVPFSTYELLHSLIYPSDKTATIPLDPLLAQDYYEIESIRQSENAWLLFTHHTDTRRRVVLKILRQYEDTRYKLGTLCERQCCQQEALHCNRIFTRDVYIGLAPIYDFNLQPKRIGIGKVITEPSKEKLYPHAEYALLMDELPKGWRLDSLLKEGNKLLHQYGDKSYHEQYLSTLTRYIAHIHSDKEIALLRQSPALNRDVQWGSVEQLREKLAHNFAFVDQSLMTKKDHQYAASYVALEKMLCMLQNELMPLLTVHERCFNRRIQEKRIRRCHGDLKARNIWISPYTKDNVESWDCVKILDAVDFNPVYSNIDILSDFAMLVIDVQARTRSSALADAMIKEYLSLTQQEDRDSQFVLDYYLVEKAFIGAIINIIYDSWPGLGWSFLDVTERRMKTLLQHKSMYHSMSLLSRKQALSAPRTVPSLVPADSGLL